MQRKDLISIVEMENNALELFEAYDMGELSQKQLRELPNKLYTMYGIRGRSKDQFKARALFKAKDLKHIHGQKKAYKNIDNVPQLLQALHNKGYIGKYEHKLGRENLYYITTKCEELEEEYKVEEPYETCLNEHLRNTGLN